jgi:D-galactarolactone isomerase
MPSSTTILEGACDCHMHVFEPRFGGQGDTQTPLASAAMYREVQALLGLQRVVVVQANRYGSDNRGVLEAMATFGDGARGVVVIEPGTSDAELLRLSTLGVRGVRFHLLSGGLLGWEQLDTVVARIRPFGWHVQIQLDGWQLPLHAARLRALPLPVVIDHIGKYLQRGVPQINDPAFVALRRLLDTGHCWAKLSAPYESSRSGPPGYDDVSQLARALVASHPERCVWASNWPHPGRDPAPDNAALLDLLQHWADDDDSRQRILVQNPATLYGFAANTKGQR